MAEDTFQEKTEPATDKKKSDAREKGKVLKSMDLNSSLSLMTGLLVLGGAGSLMAFRLESFTREMFTYAGTMVVTRTSIAEIVTRAFMTIGIAISPFLIALVVIGILANVGQVGFLFSTKALEPKFEKLNPGRGIRKVLLSRRSLVELLKNLLKVFIVALAAYMSLKDILPEAITLMDGTTEAIVAFMTSTSLAVGWKVGLAFLAVSVADYVFQRFEYERDLRMTKQEVKEEAKMLEGDPLIKGKIRTIQRQIAYKRMMQDVPKADVVVTNPTHFAVALKYDIARMSAPTVVAKGADLIALRIKSIAVEHDIPIVEDKPLAQILYKSVEVGDQVPQKLFQAVAQVLAYIYRMKKTKHGYTTH
jgi:flagellar biosynthesis protein FlhB